jgi:hypothetical protein
VHAPPVQLVGSVADLCFDAAYDAPGTATIAANAMAAKALIFKLMRVLPRGSIMANGNVCAVADPTRREHAALPMNNS